MNVFEIEILQFINSNLSNRILDAVFVTISRLGDKGALWIVCALILCIFPKTRKAGICASISLLLCLFVGNLILKPLFDRMRPYEFDTSLKIIIPLLKDAKLNWPEYSNQLHAIRTDLTALTDTLSVLVGIDLSYKNPPGDDLMGAILEAKNDEDLKKIPEIFNSEKRFPDLF